MSNLILFIGPFEIIAGLTVILILFLIALFLVGKYERGLIYFIWLFVLILLPVIGPIAYLLKYFAATKGTSSRPIRAIE